MKLNGGRSRDEILAEVESVRSDMDSTLSAIERKLTPGQLVDQGIEYLRTSGANEFLSNLGTSVKQNPIPVALVGVCMAWLMASSRSGTSAGTSGPGRVQSAGTSFRRATDEAWSGARDQARSARKTLSEAAQTARERFDQAKHTVSGTAQSAHERFDQARNAVSDTAQAAREALSRGADVAQRQVERARGGYEWILREQPLALGAIGIAVGAVLAAAAPRTRTEDEWMGEASDRLAERAKEAGRQQVERAGDAMRSATAGEGLEGGVHGVGGATSAGSAEGEMSQGAGQTTPGTTAPGESKQSWPSGRPPSE